MQTTSGLPSYKKAKINSLPPSYNGKNYRQEPKRKYEKRSKYMVISISDASEKSMTRDEICDLLKLSWCSIRINHLNNRAARGYYVVSTSCPIEKKQKIKLEIESFIDYQNEINDSYLFFYKDDPMLYSFNNMDMIWDLVKKRCYITSEYNNTSRKRECVLPRQIAIYIARKHTELSWAKIGGFFGHSHSDAIHNNRAIEDLIDTNSNIRELVNKIENELKSNKEK